MNQTIELWDLFGEDLIVLGMVKAKVKMKTKTKVQPSPSTFAEHIHRIAFSMAIYSRQTG